MSAEASSGMGAWNRQGSYGEHLVATIAASAGLMTTKWDLDFNGIDLEFCHPGVRGTRRHPSIGAQIKTWNNPEGSTEEWSYPLKARNYNELAGTNFDHPRFLFLVIVPGDPGKWLRTDHQSVRFTHAVYWCCLHDHPPRPENSSTVTVKVPKANLVSTQSLLGLFGDVYRKKLA